MINLHNTKAEGVRLRIKDIDSVTPFPSGVEYCAPARGTWTIAHIPMLIPDSYQIYVCAPACVRGVVLSAEEYNGLDRFSMIVLSEKDILEGNMEEIFIEGISEILNKLLKKPSAVLSFTSCIHHFLACDLKLVYKTLRQRFPDIDFISCYMNPTMRKSKITPEELMRKQMYAALDNMPKEVHSVNVIGNSYEVPLSCECLSLLSAAGYTVRDICRCQTYTEYKEMSRSSVNLYFQPLARQSALELEQRLGQKAVYLPFTYDMEEIEEDLTRFCEEFQLPLPDFAVLRAKSEAALQQALDVIGDMPIAIDYLATQRPLGLAKLLLSHGFHVTSVYADCILPEDVKNLLWLKEYAGNLEFIATINFKCRLFPRDEARLLDGKLLAIGQKAAYFTGTKHFVNIVENNGYYGFDGICRLAELMKDAVLNEKDTKSIITVKGWGCQG